jgi:acyl-coenzyme A synthetase/AMP-(fatty) acid ligase
MILQLLGYAGFLVCPIYLDCVGVMAPPQRLIDADLADEMHRYARLDGGMYHPSLLQDLVRDENKRQELGKLRSIFYSGSPLETTTGQWLASTFGTVRNLLGSTESFGWPIAEVIDPVNDWNYIHFYPTNGLHFEPVGLESVKDATESGEESNEDGELYELIVHRTPETEALTNIFLSRPDATEWPTRDLWKPHPDPAKKGHWLYRGRTDDLVVLSGEIKMYAAYLEDKISSAHPLIRTALIGGNQRKWPFLLLELIDSTTATADATTTTSSTTLDEIWSHLTKINALYTHGSVHLRRSLVLVVDKSRPFVRLAKGSVARNPTYELYKQEIDNLYAEMEK